MPDDHLQGESLRVLSRVREIIDNAERNVGAAAFRIDGATWTDQVPDRARSRAKSALTDLEAAAELLSDWIDTHGSDAWDEKYDGRFKQQ